MTPDDYKELLTKVKSKRERTASRGIVFTEKPLVLPDFGLKQGILKDKLESNERKLKISTAHRKAAQEEADKIRHRIESSLSSDDNTFCSNL